MSTTATIILAAVIVGLATMVTGYMQAARIRHDRRIERMEELRNANAIADRAAELTTKLIGTNEQIARRTNESASIIETKLSVIHTLTNSALTAAKQSECDAVAREFSLMKEVIELRRRIGQDPSDDAMRTLELTGQKLETLTAELAMRRAQDEITNRVLDRVTE